MLVLRSEQLAVARDFLRKLWRNLPLSAQGKRQLKAFMFTHLWFLIPDQIRRPWVYQNSQTESKDSVDYAQRLVEEGDAFDDLAQVHALPDIFHYWSNKHLLPIVKEFEIEGIDQFFAKYLAQAATTAQCSVPTFLSVGAGNCDTEVRVAKLMKQGGLEEFTIECMEYSPDMLARGRLLARQEGVLEHMAFLQADANSWKASSQYTGVMANQFLHHVLNLEGLFETIGSSLDEKGLFVVSDVIGRNGHQRWPEALELVQKFWEELPKRYRYNHALNRYEQRYENWDWSKSGFEGIRAQDVLPLLIQRFYATLFIPFGNVIDVFIDRAFGYNFDPRREWDREFIDRVHQCDEQGFKNGGLTPTHMMAVFTRDEVEPVLISRGLSPKSCVRESHIAS